MDMGQRVKEKVIAFTGNVAEREMKELLAEMKLLSFSILPCNNSSNPPIPGRATPLHPHR